MLNSGNTSPSILSSDDEENDEQDITRAETSNKKRKDISRDNNGGDRASELMGMYATKHQTDQNVLVNDVPCVGPSQ